MVFTTIVNCVRARGPDEFWRKRRIFKLAAHYIGRRRNCYTVAIKIVHRALVYATKGRQLRKQDITELRNARIIAGCEQHGLNFNDLREGLLRCNIMLNRKTLADLAAWEPYSFKALTDIAKQKTKEDGFGSVKDLQAPVGVITRGMSK
ncbi:hypothetical protein ILUMI_07368 [Ignelater luminosus]|uniref:Large ribosomal subunit protein bL20m n=1 Tax=Ignelater luminosus TaxID=2038154 RepID=A0A8K0D6L6_IGNLU|nr:hypothetical protein ILUMI_07368 [Ignelater luminosus]